MLQSTVQSATEISAESLTLVEFATKQERKT